MYEDEHLESDYEDRNGYPDELDILDEEFEMPWVYPGPTEQEKSDQAERVRKADEWVESGELNYFDQYGTNQQM
jgi:hypothetical protein